MVWAARNAVQEAASRTQVLGLPTLKLGQRRGAAHGQEHAVLAGLLGRDELDAVLGHADRFDLRPHTQLVEQPLELAAGPPAVAGAVDVEVAVPGGDQVQAFGPAAHEGQPLGA